MFLNFWGKKKRVNWLKLGEKSHQSNVQGELNMKHIQREMYTWGTEKFDQLLETQET